MLLESITVTSLHIMAKLPIMDTPLYNTLRLYDYTAAQYIMAASLNKFGYIIHNTCIYHCATYYGIILLIMSVILHNTS